MTGYIKPVNPKDPILNRDIIPKKDKKMDVKKAIDLINEIMPGIKKLEELKKAKDLDKTVDLVTIHPSEPAKNDPKAEGLDKVDPNTKLPGILMNKANPEVIQKMCKAISCKYGPKAMEKASEHEQGVHGQNIPDKPGVSPMGELLRQKNPTNKDHFNNTAKKMSRIVRQGAKDMPKPNLPKSEAAEND